MLEIQGEVSPAFYTFTELASTPGILACTAQHAGWQWTKAPQRGIFKHWEPDETLWVSVMIGGSVVRVRECIDARLLEATGQWTEVPVLGERADAPCTWPVPCIALMTPAQDDAAAAWGPRAGSSTRQAEDEGWKPQCHQTASGGVIFLSGVLSHDSGQRERDGSNSLRWLRNRILFGN